MNLMNVIKEYNFYYENVIQKYKWNNKANRNSRRDI